MKAVVMAGGYGTRLRPLTIKQPKPMIPVCNRPMLEHILRLLKRHGFTDVLMLTYFFPETIENYFGDGSALGMNITYRQDPPGGLGTAGAVKGVEDLIDGPFLVISGDVITDFDLTRAMEFHRRRGELTTMILTRVHNPLPFGVVITDDDSRVSRFLEKPSWGEVFSDTINTGIYIMEPEVLARIPEGEQKDFSRDIFPALLEEGRPPGAFVAEGYWKDVGNTVEYLQIHHEIASGLLELEIPGRVEHRDQAAIYLGEGASIHPDANVSGMVVLGDGTEVDRNARIRDSFVGSGCRIGSDVRMRSSIIWDDTVVDSGAFVAGSVIGARSNIRARANVEEGAIISEGCDIGRGSIIRAGVRVWPHKVVEDEAVLSTHFVHGSRWRGTLFAAGIIKGLANKEITPEFASRLGAAFGATFPERSSISLSRGMHRSVRMVTRALASGVLSSGVDVLDYGVIPIPVCRHQMGDQREMGGVHVRLAPSDPEVVETRLFRKGGRELDAGERNAVDRFFFQLDFRRAAGAGVGEIAFPDYGTDSYRKAFLAALNVEAIRKARPRIVMDYSYGSTLKLLPALLGKLGVEVVSLNAHIDDEKVSRTTREFDRDVRKISEVVRGLGAALGAIISASGETLFLVDEQGRWIDGGRLMLALARMVFETSPGSRVAVTASASSSFEKLADQYGGQVVRTPINPSALLEGAVSAGVYLAGNSEGGVAFPDFHPSFDAMFTLGRLLELLSITGKSLGQEVDALPQSHLLHSIVPCPWEAKGKVMRKLVEELGEEAKGIEGVRVESKSGWILVYPSSNHTCFHVYSEDEDADQAAVALEEWSRRVAMMQQ